MAIDILDAAKSGELMTLREVARLLGKRWETVRSWTLTGKRGAILECAFDGAALVTTRESLRIFLETINAHQRKAPSESTKKRNYAHERAVERLKARGL
jgi:hypothetical protein